jgi:hypothetical protein
LEVKEPALVIVGAKYLDNIAAGMNAGIQALGKLWNLGIEGKCWKVDQEHADVAHQLQVRFRKFLVLV